MNNETLVTYALIGLASKEVNSLGFIIDDDIGVVSYVNEHLVKAVEWQDHPDIAHDEVKLGGELSIFYPTWNDEIVISNGAAGQQIRDEIRQSMEKR